MRKIITILIVWCLLPCLGYAKHMVHAKHMEFMGIPISGTINEFQAQLFKKGFEVSGPKIVSLSEDPYGNDVYKFRYYRGRFAERDSHISVTYDARTKSVFECRILLSESFDKEPITQEWSFFKKLLLQKYYDRVVVIEDNNSQNNRPMTSCDHGIVIKGLLLSFFENPRNKESKSYGSINLDLEELLGTDGEHEYPFYWLTITYRKKGFYGRDEILKDL